MCFTLSPLRRWLGAGDLLRYAARDRESEQYDDAREQKEANRPNDVDGPLAVAHQHGLVEIALRRGAQDQRDDDGQTRIIEADHQIADDAEYGGRNNGVAGHSDCRWSWKRAPALQRGQ